MQIEKGNFHIIYRGTEYTPNGVGTLVD